MVQTSALVCLTAASLLSGVHAMTSLGRTSLRNFRGNGPSDEVLAVYGALGEGATVAEEEYFSEAQVDNFYTENRAGSYGPTCVMIY